MYSGSPSHPLDPWGEENLDFVHCDIRGGKAKLCISKLILVFYQLASVGHKLLYGQNLKLKYYIYFNSTYSVLFLTNFDVGLNLNGYWVSKIFANWNFLRLESYSSTHCHLEIHLCKVLAKSTKWRLE